MASRSEMLGNGTRRGEETLGMPWRLEPLHPAFSLPCGLVSIFRPVVEIAMPPIWLMISAVKRRCW